MENVRTEPGERVCAHRLNYCGFATYFLSSGGSDLRGQTWDETNNLSHPSRYLMPSVSSSQFCVMGWCQVQDTGHTIPVTELGRHAIFTATMLVFSDAF